LAHPVFVIFKRYIYRKISYYNYAELLTLHNKILKIVFGSIAESIGESMGHASNACIVIVLSIRFSWSIGVDIDYTLKK